MARLGYVFILKEINSHFISPPGDRAPLITGHKCADVEHFFSKIGALEAISCAADTKLRIDLTGWREVNIFDDMADEDAGRLSPKQKSTAAGTAFERDVWALCLRPQN